MEELAGWLVENRFQNTTAVELPGEFSVRGGILDIFAPDWYDPVRLELFGDEIESIPPFRGFQPAEPGQPGGVEVTRASAGAGGAAAISPTSCRRGVGFCC